MAGGAPGASPGSRYPPATSELRSAGEPRAAGPPPLQICGCWRAQVLLQRDFEVHKFVAFRVMRSHQVEAGARQRIRDVGDIEKQKPTRSGVWFHRLGAKLSPLDFIPCLAACTAL